MKKKILHIITSLLDGGAEGVLYRLCCNDKMNQHLVVSMRGEGKYGKLLSKNGVKVYTLNMKPGKFSFIALYKLIRIIKSEKVNIVQTWLYHADFFDITDFFEELNSSPTSGKNIFKLKCLDSSLIPICICWKAPV